MRRIPVPLARGAYDVVVGANVLGEAASLLDGRRQVAIITQGAVSIHADAVAEALTERGTDVSTHVIGPAEDAKSLATVEALCRELAVAGLLRGDAIVAVGGGVVGDCAGFAAAVYHRGVTLVQVPTTLLAQVDAAIGGKTAVNLPEGKNLVGSFHQPVGVVADVATLATLPEAEYRAGLGEVAKYVLMGDAEIARVVDGRAPELLARDPAVLEDVVARCVAMKASIVAADEEETTGRRAALNYGHTLAHALETLGDYDLAHGEAVAIGLVFAAELAGALERIDPARVRRHREVVEALHLPAEVPYEVSAADLVAQMTRDKKARGGLTFVLEGASGLELVDDPDAGAVHKALAAVGAGGD